jgi:hypothetical protein
MELLITVVSLAVAIYAVTPRERQLSLMLKLGAFGSFWIFAAVFFLATFYLSFYEFFEAHGTAAHSTAWPTGITPTRCVPLVLLAGMCVLWIRIKYTRLSVRHIRRFHKLAGEMLWNGAHAELLALFQDHIRELFAIAHSDFRLSKLRRRIVSHLSPKFEDLIASLDPEIRAIGPNGIAPGGPKPLNWALRFFAKPLLRVLPTYDAEALDASEIIRTVLLNEPFVASLARYRPYLGVKALEIWTEKYDREEFLNLYMNELMGNTTSIIYAEIAANQNQLRGPRYELPRTNRLLCSLFADARVAHSLEVYRPVGEFALRELDRLAKDPQNDPYNRPLEDFDEAGCWRSSIFVCLRFFDIMVTEALFQGIEWHMWLYYLTHFTEKIVRNYRPSEPDVDDDKEWSIKYSWLLYQIFSTLRDWIKATNEVSDDQKNIQLQNSRADNENNNIAKSSILALGHCVSIVLKSDAIGDALKNSLTDMAFELYFGLRRSQNRSAYAQVLAASLQNGGTMHLSSRRDHRQALAAYFQRNKHEYLITHLHESVLELEREVG